MRAEVSQSLQTVEKRRERARLHMREVLIFQHLNLYLAYLIFLYIYLIQFRKTLSEEQRKRNRDATRAVLI